jgi:hypothetical protein
MVTSLWMLYLHYRLRSKGSCFQGNVRSLWMIRNSMAASPVAQLKKTKGDRDCNTHEVTDDVQDVQSGSQSTVAVVAVVGRAAGHDGESRWGILM